MAGFSVNNNSRGGRFMRNKFFVGTYGWDKLSKFLFVVGALLLISKFTAIIGVVIIAYAFIRTLSKNFTKREREEMAFEEWLRNLKYGMEKMKVRFRGLSYNLHERRNYVIVKCPNCSQKLRLPRHKGKIIVTCKRCSKEFRIKT